MSAPIRSAAVLGAGTMGAQIAAHLANAGVPVALLDLTAEAAGAGLKRLASIKPDPLFTAGTARLIRPGGFDDLAPLAGADWIVEAVVEDLAVKQELLARVESRRAAHAIVSSNTSGIPLAAIADGRGAAFRRHWIGTHFFNPPRYLPLVEVIPTADTDPAIAASLTDFLDRRLGKGTVTAADAPGFIANRIGLFGVARLFEALASGAFTIEEIDELTGPLAGRPKSATFRTLDLTGLDIVARVAADLARRLPADEAARFALPPLVDAMVGRGLIGEKAGGGFYRRDRDDTGATAIRTLDPVTFEYRERREPAIDGLEAARAIADPAARLRALLLAPGRAGDLLRRTLGDTLVYAARVAPAVAPSIDDVDRAMRWGFGWALGPFETWDAVGIRALLDALGVTDPPPLVREALDAGRDRFRDGPLPPAGPGRLLLRTSRQASKVVKSNAGASLIDLGDGVLGVEFHTKMNAIGGDTIAMLRDGVTEAETNFQALVVGGEAEHFSAGANLMLLLLEAQEENWDEIDLMVRAFQDATMRLKTAAVPVVVAPAGLALGGGCEVVLHAARVQAAAETYAGLVEVGVGLIPAGGGTKEMLVRAVDGAAGGELLPAVQRAFETIGFARVSASAAHARELGYLRGGDGVTMNRERLIADAKAAALTLAAAGYQPAARRTAIRVGGRSLGATLQLGVHLAWRAGRLSDHDALIGRKLASILAGGDVPHRTEVGEDYLLDLEREAFLSLCGERRTQERIAYTLKTGRTLRN